MNLAYHDEVQQYLLFIIILLILVLLCFFLKDKYLHSNQRHGVRLHGLLLVRPKPHNSIPIKRQRSVI